jgi:hypothetical protein
MVALFTMENMAKPPPDLTPAVNQPLQEIFFTATRHMATM